MCDITPIGDQIMVGKFYLIFYSVCLTYELHFECDCELVCLVLGDMLLHVDNFTHALS